MSGYLEKILDEGKHQPIPMHSIEIEAVEGGYQASVYFTHCENWSDVNQMLSGGTLMEGPVSQTVQAALDGLEQVAYER